MSVVVVVVKPEVVSNFPPDTLFRNDFVHDVQWKWNHKLHVLCSMVRLTFGRKSPAAEEFLSTCVVDAPLTCQAQGLG